MYRIIPIDAQISSHSKQASPLPQHQFSQLILAPRGSGKSTFLINLLLNPNFYKGYFHQIHVFTPTLFQDEKWQIVKSQDNILAQNKVLEKLLSPPREKKSYSELIEGSNLVGERFTGRIPEENFHSEYDEAVLKQIFEDQKLQIEFLQTNNKLKTNSDKILLIFDDALALNKQLFKHNSFFQQLNTFNRHFNISIIIVSQAYKQIPRTIRVNMNSYILFEISNDKELRLFYEENTLSISWEKWLEYYNTCIKEPYSFMYINYQHPKGKRIMKRFEETLG